MPDDTLYHVKPAFAAAAHVNADHLHAMRNQAGTDPDGFWAAQAARRVDWIKAPTVIRGGGFGEAAGVRWFEDGVLNASATCLDRHLPQGGARPAIIWEGDEPGQSRTISYRELHAQVCRLAGGLRALGVRRGDRVAVYLPMIPEAAVAMLACARIGAPHCVVFGGFSPEALAGRIQDCGAVALITADAGRRGGKRVALKAQADAAVQSCPSIRHVVVVREAGQDGPMQAGRDVDYATLLADQPPTCAPEPMGAEDTLFILHTSGSTGAPKGIVHSTAGYLVWASFTQELVFDTHPGEVTWCTADLGWITGHTYGLYGPLANGGTTLLFEGVPTHPDAGRCWHIVDQHQVAQFYTAPTVLRALMREGDAPVRRHARTSLRVLGSVGEPINREAWLWFHRTVGDERCPVVDTWWQTETGGIMIAPLPGAVLQKPGSATLPLPGIEPVLVDDDGAVLEGEAEGNLCFARSWPGQARGVHGDPARFTETYFSRFPGLYWSGDGARRDADGYYWITGRVDDVINVSGHRIGSAEVEAALTAHPDVAEAAAVGAPHPVKGEAVHAYVTLRAGCTGTDALRAALIGLVRQRIGGFAAPDALRWADALPKTRSGKIMRRILRKLAAGMDDVGDVSTLADPAVIDALRDAPSVS